MNLASTSRQQRFLRFEQLQARDLFATISINMRMGNSFDTDSGVLSIFGKEQHGAGNTVVIYRDASTNRLSIRYSRLERGFWDPIAINTTSTYDLARLYGQPTTAIKFFGTARADFVDNQTEIPLEADGFTGADTFLGGSGDDTLRGGDQDDTLEGRGGNDRLFGDNGHDTLRGGINHDWLWGGAGDDKLWGGSGNDVLYGEAGYDRLFGEQDNDALFGGSEIDRLYGGSANQLGSETETDNNFLAGEAGSDFLYGENGNDAIFGDAAVIRQVMPGQSTAGTFMAYGARWNLSSQFALHLLSHALPNRWTAAQTGLFTSGNFLGFGRENYSTLRSDASDLVLSTWAEKGNFADEDVFEGRDGSDLMVGSIAKDRMDGGLKADQLFGGGNDDNLDAGASSGVFDRISSGSGRDTVVTSYRLTTSLTASRLIRALRNVELVLLDFDPVRDQEQEKLVANFTGEGLDLERG